MEEAEYRKMAGVEDRMWYYRALHGLMERELGRVFRSAPASILDAGCGTGGLIRRLSPLHPDWRWTGVDLSALACSLASERTPGKIVTASVEALPFGKESFDAVVSADVLYHVDDDEKALREAFRVLRPGGILILNVPAYRWLWSYHDVAVHSRRRYGRSEVVAKLERAGFGAIRATHWNCLLFPALALRRKCLPAPAGGSDVKLGSAPVEVLLRAISGFETAWIGAGGKWPYGSSVFAIGRRL